MKKVAGLIRLAAAIAVAAAIAIAAVGCSGSKSALNPKSPVSVTVWTYYNGGPLEAFRKLVDEFNSTIGIEKGVVVIDESLSDIDTLADSLIASVNKEAGAKPVPALAAVYAETAFILDKEEALAPLDSYFTKEELALFVPGFIDEGRFNAKGELLLFPILKSTEVFTANETDWAPFAQATGITIESLKTKEDLTSAAKAYYEWIDAQTPDIREDGKALYGRDSLANYVYLGCYQLGHELFKVESGKMTADIDRGTFRTLWDNYYIPYINGYFGSYAKFRSEDCKTGRILSLTSSSSSAGYLPTAVTTQDDETHDITTYVGKTLPFAGSVNKAAVQQGASYCLLKGSAAQQEGAIEFLKWFTQPERNTQFAMMSGYSPVTLAANTPDAITKAYSGDANSAKGQNVLGSLIISADTFINDNAYATKPFEGSKDARAILGDFMQITAQQDREAVVAAINAGSSREEAVAQYVTDEYFDAWFDELVRQVNAIIGA